MNFLKQILEKKWVFDSNLKLLGFIAQNSFLKSLTKPLTNFFAYLNLRLNKPKHSLNAKELAESWKNLMPVDGQEYFKIDRISEETAYVEIHIKCPLRDSGNVNAFFHLMNYDRKLMEGVGGELVVLSSQSNNKKGFCQLAIRKSGTDLGDLLPAHKY